MQGGGIMRIVFFSRPKPKQFTYKPRYWDERKEQLELSRKKYDGTAQTGNESAMRQHLNMHWRRSIDRTARKKTSNLMLLVYLALIALIVWFIFL